MYYRPTKIDYEGLKFLIMSAPVDSIMKQTLKDLKHYGCDLLVRTCEKTYNDQMILDEGIRIIELEFPDGNSPPAQVIKTWLKIVKDHFGPVNNNGSAKKEATYGAAGNKKQSRINGSNTPLFASEEQKLNNTTNESNHRSAMPPSNNGIDYTPGRIGVHCLAGLGRAPVLVAIALIHYGSSPENAIALIRKARPGAINHSQAHFILNYKKPGSSCNIF